MLSNEAFKGQRGNWCHFSDYTNASDCELFPLKFCSIRRVENTIIDARARAVLIPFKKYVAYCISNKKIPTSGDFQVIEEPIIDPHLVAKLAFFYIIL